MRGIVSTVYAALAGLVLVAVVAQFFLAGVGVFGALSYQPHIIDGMLVAAASVVLLLLALLGGLGRPLVLFSALLVILMVVQIALIESGSAWLEALHPLNALAILGVSVHLAMRSGLFGRRGRPVAGERLTVAPGRESESWD